LRTRCPFPLLRPSTSALPSASKSPTPSASQFVSAIAGRNAEISTDKPFINQPMFWPLALLRHSTSDLPSPLKSPLRQEGPVVMNVASDPAVVPPELVATGRK